jgi:Leucine-rich repeat (LRR) protein
MPKLMSLLQLVLVILFTPSLCCPEDQKQALLHFKAFFLNATAYSALRSPEFRLESWNSSSDCCQWERVNCTSPFGSKTVISLDLSYLVDGESEEPRVLSFTIFTPLFRIRSLTELHLSENRIQGEFLGDSLANMSKLVFLDLSGNSFHGNIPKEIGNMTKLQQLSLSGNNFFGEIPASILNLKELKTLDLSYNSLSMEIPIDTGNLSNITTLDFSNNNLTSTIPSSIQKLTKLETLYLQNNLLTGDIPSWLFDIKSLKYLFLGGNYLAWNNKAKVTPRCTLFVLSMRSCVLSGEIPDWISTQKTLGILDLSENQLEGTFPLWLAEMNVNYIFLSGNNLKGFLPPSLFNNSPSLKVLSLSRNNFYGELPSNIGNATKISDLFLDRNNFSGKLPESIVNSYYLTFLDLSNNKFFGDTLPDFSSNVNLQFIDFSSNEFSAEISTNFPQATTLLSLGKNKFSGNLSRILTNLSNL